VPMDALAHRGAAVTLEDCECLGVRVSERTDGETVAKALTEIFATAGAPVAVSKDGGGDLSKGVALWKERAGKPTVWTIEISVMSWPMRSKPSSTIPEPFSVLWRLSMGARPGCDKPHWPFLCHPSSVRGGDFKGSLAWANGLKRYSRPWREAGVLKTTA